MYYALTVPTEWDWLGGAFSAERWAYAGKMTLIGMLMIFAVLATLWAVLAVFKLIFAKPAKKAEPAKKVETAPAPAPAASAPAAADDAQLVAVLTAAVAAYMAAENGGAAPTTGFRVVSYRRANGGRPWNSK